MSETGQETSESEPVSGWLLVVGLILLYLAMIGLVFLSPIDQWVTQTVEWTVAFLLIAFFTVLTIRARARHPSSTKRVRNMFRIYGVVLIVAGFAFLAAGLLLYGNVFVFSATPVFWVLGSCQIWWSYKKR